tara:strand:- start:257 stop:469 length:213 start_codon:yes stop_codon:yes gene_type:complete
MVILGPHPPSSALQVAGLGVAWRAVSAEASAAASDEATSVAAISVRIEPGMVAEDRETRDERRMRRESKE